MLGHTERRHVGGVTRKKRGGSITHVGITLRERGEAFRYAIHGDGVERERAFDVVEGIWGEVISVASQWQYG
jgi:hypothetical protein